MAKKHLRYTAEKGERKLKCTSNVPSPFQLSFNIHRFTPPYFPSIAPPLSKGDKSFDRRGG